MYDNALNQIIEKHLEFNINAHAIFIVFVKAFDKDEQGETI